MIYVYENSFEGYLSAVFEIYVDKDKEAVLENAGEGIGGLDNIRVVPVNEAKARRVQQALERLSTSLPRTLYRAWLSREEDVDEKVLQVIRLAFTYRQNPLSRKYETAPNRVCELSRKVGWEAERMLQFIRFSVHPSGLMVADVEPLYDVLNLIGGHFCGRYPAEPFVIRDIRHRKTLVWDTHSRYVSDDPALLLPALPEDEKFAELWRKYFHAVAIPERINPDLQRQFVPLKYREHMIEMYTKARG